MLRPCDPPSSLTVIIKCCSNSSANQPANSCQHSNMEPNCLPASYPDFALQPSQQQLGLRQGSQAVCELMPQPATASESLLEGWGLQGDGGLYPICCSWGLKHRHICTCRDALAHSIGLMCYPGKSSMTASLLLVQCMLRPVAFQSCCWRSACSGMLPFGHAALSMWGHCRCAFTTLMTGSSAGVSS